MDQALGRLEDMRSAQTIFASIARSPVEIAAFAFLDADHQVIAVRHAAVGSVASVDLPIRLVAREALALDAAGLVMAHNHPSNAPAPSEADIAVTRHAERLFGTLELKLIDHLIVTPAGTTSLRALGLL